MRQALRGGFLAVLLAACAGGFARAQEEPAPEQIEFWIGALTHPDDAIRESAFRRLENAGPAAAARLAGVIAADEPRAAVAAAMILTHLGDRGAPAGERLAAVLANRRAEGWRWSVAAFVQAQVLPSALSESLPHFREALRGDDAFRLSAAVQAAYRLGPEAAAAIPELKALLARPELRFHNVSIDKQALEWNRYGWTEELGVQVYDERGFAIDAPQQNEPLLVLRTLQRVGASPAEILPLVQPQTHSLRPDVLLAAAELMSELGPDGVRAAVPLWSWLLRDASGLLIRRLADAGDELRSPSGEPTPLLDQLAAAGEHAPTLLPQLTNLLRHSNPAVRLATATVLQRWGAAAAPAGPALERALALETLRRPEAVRDPDVIEARFQEALDAVEGPPAPPSAPGAPPAAPGDPFGDEE